MRMDMEMETLQTSEKIKQEVESLESWHYENDALRREFKFQSFAEAMSFMVRIGFTAEAMNHHPEIFNSYTRVALTLRTHDAGDVTMKDVELARAINRISWV